MHEGSIVASNFCVFVVRQIELIAIVVGVLEARARSVAVIGTRDDHCRHDVWLRFGRWLAVGLTFLLAADILKIAIPTSWDEVGRLAAIAAIRAGLDYFLERGLGEFRDGPGSAADRSA